MHLPDDTTCVCLCTCEQQEQSEEGLQCCIPCSIPKCNKMCEHLCISAALNTLLCVCLLERTQAMYTTQTQLMLCSLVGSWVNCMTMTIAVGGAERCLSLLLDPVNLTRPDPADAWQKVVPVLCHACVWSTLQPSMLVRLRLE